jgi:hypothetical protein
MVAYQLRHEIRITTTYQWVEGHQKERHGQHVDLDKHGMLNDLLDKEAKWYWERTNTRRSRYTATASTEWKVTLNVKRIAIPFTRDKIIRYI